MLSLTRLIYNMKFKYLLLIIIAVIIFTIAGSFIVNKFTETAVSTAGEYAVSSLGSVSVNIDEIMKNVEFVFTPLLTNHKFVDLTQNLQYLNPVKNYEDFDKKWELSEILSKSYISNNYIDSICFYNINDNIALSANTKMEIMPKIPDQVAGWYNNYKKLNDKTKWTVTKSLKSGEKIITNYRDVKELKGPKTIGVVSININTSVISTILSKINFKGLGYAFVMDSLGNTVVATKYAVNTKEMKEAEEAIDITKKQGYYKITLDKKPYLMAYYISQKSGLKYISAIPMKEISVFTPIVMKYIIYIYFALVGVLILMAVITYTGFYSPIRKLFVAMRRLELGDFQVRLDTGRKDDVGYIYDNFNNMVINLKKLIDDNYIFQLNKKDAQLKIILSQINEHFLYNTLDCIHWLARKQYYKEIQDVIFSLSKFYSLSLSSGHDVISIKEIGAIIDSYIHIQSVCMPDKFEYMCTLEESLKDSKALKFLFQPLVENAIIHGLETKNEKGIIEVSFKQKDGLLHFEVWDDGKGISESRIQEIRKILAENENVTDDAFALKNINLQIKLFYGEDYGLSIESVEGQGTRVWMDIPVIERGDAHA